MRRMGPEQRRARLAVRHHLAAQARAEHPVEVVRDLVCLHATDPASVMLAAVARLRSDWVEAVERALYEERSLVRMLGMRRTMFVVPVEMVPVVQASSTAALVPGERRRSIAMIEESGVAADGGRWLKEVEEATMDALRRRGAATAAELSGDVPGLREQVVGARGKPYEATQRLSTRVLFLLSAEGRIVRGRPSGSWISSQYQWAPIESWLPGGVPDLPVEVAQAELVRRWLAAFGPGTAADIRWWTGWTMRDVGRALAAVGPAEVDLDGATGLVLPEDLEPVPAPDPWVALLPALDPTPMGWTERDWYLGPHRAALFDRSGNIGPTVWSDGRIVGGWAQRRDGEVAVRLLEDVGADTAAAVDAEAAALAARLGAIRVTPRFRTPLERELSA